MILAGGGQARLRGVLRNLAVAGSGTDEGRLANIALARVRVRPSSQVLGRCGSLRC